MHQLIGSLVLGVIAGEGARKVAWRPLMKGAIRQSVRAQRGFMALTSSVRAEAETLVAEARADIDSAPRPSKAKHFKDK